MKSMIFDYCKDEFIRQASCGLANQNYSINNLATRENKIMDGSFEPMALMASGAVGVASGAIMRKIGDPDSTITQVGMTGLIHGGIGLISTTSEKFVLPNIPVFSNDAVNSFVDMAVGPVIGGGLGLAGNALGTSVTGEPNMGVNFLAGAITNVVSGKMYDMMTIQ